MMILKTYCYMFIGFAVYSLLLAVWLRFLVGRISKLEIEDADFYEKAGIPKGRKKTLQILFFVCIGVSIFCCLFDIGLLHYFKYVLAVV